MKNKSQLILILSPFISIGIGMVFDLIFNKPEYSIIIAFLSEVIILFLQLELKLVEIKKGLVSLIDYIGYFKEKDSSNLYQYALENVPREEMPQLWKKLVWKMKNNFFATSYMDKDDSWLHHYAKYADECLEIQKIQIGINNVEVKRIFIIDNVEEIEKLTSVMKKQISYGIKVRYIPTERIEKNDWLNKFKNENKTIDFGLFDGNIVFLWYLNNKRKIMGGRILVGNDNYKKYLDFHNKLWNESIEL